MLDQQHRRADDVTRTDARKQVETGIEARQGFIGRPVFYVLIGGLILAGLFLVGTLIWSTTESLPPEGAIGNEVSAPPVGEPAAPAGSLPADAVPPPAEALPPAGIAPSAGMPAPAPAPAGN